MEIKNQAMFCSGMSLLRQAARAYTGIPHRPVENDKNEAVLVYADVYECHGSDRQLTGCKPESNNIVSLNFRTPARKME
jgi:hypothetical protein